MNLCVKNIIVIGVGLFCIYIGPWWLVGPIIPFFLLLFLAFVWANARVWPQIQSRAGRWVAVVLFSIVCTTGAFWPFMMARSERSEKFMWKGVLEQMEQLFPYEVTGPNGTVQRMSGTNGVDLSTHSVRLITNSTWEAMQRKKK